jgi:hypothetical protein
VPVEFGYPRVVVLVRFLLDIFVFESNRDEIVVFERDGHASAMLYNSVPV